MFLSACVLILSIIFSMAFWLAIDPLTYGSFFACQDSGPPPRPTRMHSLKDVRSDKWHPHCECTWVRFRWGTFRVTLYKDRRVVLVNRHNPESDVIVSGNNSSSVNVGGLHQG